MISKFRFNSDQFEFSHISTISLKNFWLIKKLWKMKSFVRHLIWNWNSIQHIMRSIWFSSLNFCDPIFIILDSLFYSCVCVLKIFRILHCILQFTWKNMKSLKNYFPMVQIQGEKKKKHKHNTPLTIIEWKTMKNGKKKNKESTSNYSHEKQINKVKIFFFFLFSFQLARKTVEVGEL